MKQEFVRFAIAGGIGFAVDAGILYGMLAIGAGYFVGRLVSFLAAVWTTWQINRRFTFVPNNSGTRWQEWWRYLSAMLGGGSVNYAAYSVTVMLLPSTPLKPLFAVAVGSIVGMIVNFLSAKLWVFKKR
ncbi:GtrA-like protein [Caballeronia arationis]|jgi:putative flippase GtrA|uniref:Flippase GtrA (Transmembrane translocase of bactoprenol-linked glucose) n=1 Tax=Caballeronia arationis TaxID=1777142 RepID=A0A7Z7I8N6_9BURK|nr:GtrA family protein [Caballeronia arationis]SAL07480.1 GtrA-like protein [Caballeronia arationis]SOE80781.1 Putative flippase GtrA (transmembrane translocase of bactoprenol-linked glucose) [Caballeronia arationis]